MLKKNKRFIIYLLFIFPLQAQQFFPNHPELDWQVIETPNFLIHYTQETAWTAAMAAKVAEEVILSIETMYEYKPEKKYVLILKDIDDYSNGAAYFFNDKVEIWAQNLDYPMRGTRHWLYDVLTHELTHMINIQASIKSSKTVPFGFIQVLTYEEERRADVIRGFPNGIVSYPVPSINIPVWFAEGTAQYQNKESRYDYWDSHRDMILRDRFEHNAVLTYSEMGVFGKDSHGNESAYNSGYDFVRYLAYTYGDTVLKNIVKNNSHFTNWTFSSAFEEAVGKAPEEVFKDWYSDRKNTYAKRLDKMRDFKVTGRPIEREGFANLTPRISPDGRKIAYISNKGNDYWSQNRLILKDLSSGKENIIDSYIATGPAFSPDGKYLAYTKSIEPGNNDSHFQDIFIYDIVNETDYKLSENLRARSLDWSVNNELVFVISQDGTGYLYTVAFSEGDIEREYDDYYIKIHGGEINDSVSDGQESEWREVSTRFAQRPELLSGFTPGHQYYSPRWSPNGKKIVFTESNGYTRSISMMDMQTGKKSIILDRRNDDRDAVFSSTDDRIYFASDSSGSYNIYSADLGGSNFAQHTNVLGGAFMPDVIDKQMVYALYDSIGYKIHYFPNIENVQVKDQGYITNFKAYIPEKSFNNVDTLLAGGKPYRANFNNFQILPRIFFDYGTFKPGVFLMNSDPLDKWMFFGGFAMNFDLERDIYIYTAYNGLKPTLFLEFYNVTQNIEDEAQVPVSEEEAIYIPQDINFNLIRASVGIEYTLGALNLKGEAIYNKYDATITSETYYDSTRNELYEGFDLSYTYLKGPHLSFSASWDSRKRDRFTDIAPRGGRYAFFRYTAEWNEFLDDFKTSAINIEEYVKYNFNRFELIWEEFFRIPGTRYHSLTLKFIGGAIDQQVDGFFNFYAGGLIGMRGYSYYSIGGRFMSIFQASWKFPIWQEIDYEIANIYFDKMYLNIYGDIGNAWDEAEYPSTGRYKKDIGLELRMDLFSYHLFPTKVFFNVAFPFDEFTIYDTKIADEIFYKAEPRFYFGILFDFDLRERAGGNTWPLRPYSSY